jgi:hypothetical protein
VSDTRSEHRDGRSWRLNMRFQCLHISVLRMGLCMLLDVVVICR